LVVAFVGSFILIAGQFAASYMQIYMSSDTSDFTIGTDKLNYYIYVNNYSNEIYIIKDSDNMDFSILKEQIKFQSLHSTSISEDYYMMTLPLDETQYIHSPNISEHILLVVNDAHHKLKPYRHPIFITTENVPKGIETEIIAPPHATPPFESLMYIKFTNKIDVGDHSVTIRAIGGDGKERSCRINVRVREKDSVPFLVKS
jgi:hypothetical protein